MFLDYINETKGRVETISDLLSASAKGDIEIITSTLSMVEVAFSCTESASKTLDPAVEAAIDALWSDRRVVKIVDLHQLIYQDARSLMRQAVAQGRNIRAHDAIHLATAAFVSASELNTYDKKLIDKSDLVAFPVREPYLIQPTLGLDNG